MEHTGYGLSPGAPSDPFTSQLGSAIPPMSPLFPSDLPSHHLPSPTSTSTSVSSIDPSKLSLTPSGGEDEPSPPNPSASNTAGPELTVRQVKPSRGPAGITVVKLFVDVRPHPRHPICSFKVTFGRTDAQTEVIAEANRGSPIETVHLAALVPEQIGSTPPPSRHSLVVSALDQRGAVIARAIAGDFESIEQNPTVATSSLSSLHKFPPHENSHSLDPASISGAWSSSHTNDPSGGTISLAELEGPVPAKSVIRRESHQSALSLPDSPQESSPDSGLPSPGIANMPAQSPRRSAVDVSTLSSPKGSSHSGLTAKSNPNLKHPPLPSAHEYDSQPRLYRTQEMMKTMPGEPEPPAVDLQFQGNLNDMLTDWDREEFQARRRLVQFERVQDGRVVRAFFRPISQRDYRKTQVVVSCIFRFDKNDCFITSVDAIYLLEALLGDRFSTEEKNRIRRNIETFGPITCSKKKGAESEAFFNLLMSFPHPKPRNIEKNVKVFPWSRLQNILEKISTRVRSVSIRSSKVIGQLTGNVKYAVVPPHCPLSRNYNEYMASRPKLNVATETSTAASSSSQMLSPQSASSLTSPLDGLPPQTVAGMTPSPSSAYSDSLTNLSSQGSSSSLYTASAPTYQYPSNALGAPFATSEPPSRHLRSFSDDNILGHRSFSHIPPSLSAFTAHGASSPPTTLGYTRSKSIVGLMDSSHDLHMASPHSPSPEGPKFFPILFSDHQTAAPMSTGQSPLY